MAITPSELRRDVYRILDRVLETGEPIEVERGGRRLRLVPVEAPRSKLERVRTNPAGLIGDPDDLVEMDWSAYWNPGEELGGPVEAHRDGSRGSSE